MIKFDNIRKITKTKWTVYKHYVM